MALKKDFNAIKYTDPDWLDENGKPWLKDMFRDSHSQPFTNLAKAWSTFFKDVKAGNKAHAPRFKSKHRSKKSCYIANEVMRTEGNLVRLPKMGWMKMAEEVRFKGRVLGASVSEEGGAWFIALNMEVPDEEYFRTRTGTGVVGCDIGVKDYLVTSDGDRVKAPKPLKRVKRRMRIRNRSMARKVKAARIRRGDDMSKPMPKGKKLERGTNFQKSAGILARTHKHCANVRTDFLHKLTTWLCRENQTVVIENLNVAGMTKNHRLTFALSDVGLGRFRPMMEYKTKRFRCDLILADRWFASSKLCSACGWKNEALTLKDREWTCVRCHTHHDRDFNASMNLKGLATPTALPVACSSSNGDVDPKGSGGKVTPSRYEPCPLGCSGEEVIVRQKCLQF